MNTGPTEANTAASLSGTNTGPTEEDRIDPRWEKLSEFKLDDD